jgi:hypothetical protein
VESPGNRDLETESPAVGIQGDPMPERFLLASPIQLEDVGAGQYIAEPAERNHRRFSPYDLRVRNRQAITRQIGAQVRPAGEPRGFLAVVTSLVLVVVGVEW